MSKEGLVICPVPYIVFIKECEDCDKTRPSWVQLSLESYSWLQFMFMLQSLGWGVNTATGQMFQSRVCNASEDGCLCVYQSDVHIQFEYVLAIHIWSSSPRPCLSLSWFVSHRRIAVESSNVIYPLLCWILLMSSQASLNKICTLNINWQHICYSFQSYWSSDCWSFNLSTLLIVLV